MIKSENKICQNCKQGFVIEPEDFQFYEKIKVPPPTFCPECRMIRKMMWRNERNLYKNFCANCKKSILTSYSPESGYVVFCQNCWWGDDWEGQTYARDYDFSKPLFKQFNELLKIVPRWNLSISNSQNSDYCNFCVNSKNCYLSRSVINCENQFYVVRADNSRDCFDCTTLNHCEFSYECMYCQKAYNSFFLNNCTECIDSAFLYNCINCRNCFLSSNLRNRQYVFNNEQLSKDEYSKRIKNNETGSYKELVRLIDEFNNLKVKSLRKYAEIIRSTNSIGDNLSNCKNANRCFDGRDIENVKYGFRLTPTKDSMDVIHLSGELMYESASPSLFCGRQKFCQEAFDSYDVEYCNVSKSLSNCFACVGLKNKSYCILNKQYTKEEYEELIPKIIQHMNEMTYTDKAGRGYKYGEFFPAELSPFAYNETIAQEYFPLVREQATEKGYQWRDIENKIYQIDVPSEKLPDHIKDIDDSIIGKVIGCAHNGECSEQCTKAFKIVPQELQFYRRMNLALPRLCPNCRHHGRLKQRNPLKLWHRQCMCDGLVSSPQAKRHNHDGKCANEFETSYAPDRPEIIYCENCYQKEVY